MARDPRYDILFEPVKIGPVVAPNRFYQVPHCNGGGYRDPSAVAEMRKVKSEGGWGVIFTEQVELHHSSEITPYIELHLWDDKDIPMLAKMADAMHEHRSLAGIELAYSGVNGPNLYSRECHELHQLFQYVPLRMIRLVPVLWIKRTFGIYVGGIEMPLLELSKRVTI